MFAVRYELGFYIPEEILYSHRRENLKPYASVTVHASVLCVHYALMSAVSM
jgi:hypothetical protein